MIATPDTAFHAFRKALLADPVAQRHLAEATISEDFEARARAWAGSRGIALARGDLRAAAASDAADPAFQPSAGWLPVTASADARAIDWLHFAEISPNTPFFTDAAGQAACRPFNRLFGHRMSLEALLAMPDEAAAAPSGLIFHMSRCGSTLVSQMLGAGTGHVAISEPPAFDALIRAEFADPEQQAAALRALARAYARGAPRLFVKLDSWHMLALPLIQRAFPRVPWIFLYRDPAEILVSHRRMPGIHTVPGLIPLAWLGLEQADWIPGPDFTARVLGRICHAAIAHEDCSDGLLINYAELPDAFFTKILPHFGIAPDTAEIGAMRAASARNAKAPGTDFRSDGTAKQREADADVRAAAARHLAPAFTELERLGARAVEKRL